MYDLITIGELLIDFSPSGLSENGNPTFEQNPGGAPANVAAAVSKLGKKTAFIGKVGNDSFGKFLTEVLERNNICTKGLRYSENVHTTLAFVHLEHDGNRIFDFFRNPGADMLLHKNDIDFNMIMNSKIIHFGSVSMTDEPSRTATLSAINFANEFDILVSYDPNIRLPLWKSSLEAKENALLGIQYADVLKISEEELIFLTEKNDIFEGIRYLYETYNTQIILVTLGKDGCIFSLKGQNVNVKTIKVNAIDTTGAGDAFIGSFLYKLLESNKNIKDLNLNDMIEFVQFSNIAASLTTLRKGAIPSLPTIEDIAENLDNLRR